MNSSTLQDLSKGGESIEELKGTTNKAANVTPGFLTFKQSCFEQVGVIVSQ